jgi:sRNA-binding carbon storage regulator CsrA/DNA-binding Xre family transcriptional regulator
MLLLTRRPGQAITIQPAREADLSASVGALFAEGPIVVQVNRFVQDQVRLGIAAHRDLLILREEIAMQPGKGSAEGSAGPGGNGAADCRAVLAAQVRRLCRQQHLSPTQLAARSGLSLTTLAAIEQGRGLITLDDMQQLARGLGVRVGVLLAE